MDRRTNDKVVLASVGSVSVVAPSVSLMTLVALLGGRWCHDRSDDCALLIQSRSPMKRWLSGGQNMRRSDPSPLRSNSWDAQLAIPNDPRYARLETNLGIGPALEGE
ncbi:hypothetical protein TNCV_3230001 [Trichonephila clavipes]|nr:hypothetical protein TNCV_3230001 [Trichonephila clavipes]